MINMYRYNATVLRVVDGDTMDILVDLGFHISIKIRIRVLGIDTYETSGKYKEYGLKIKQVATNLLENKPIVIESFKSDTDLKTDKYGRWLCNVYYFEEGNTKSFKEWIDSKNYNKYSDNEPIFG